MAVGVCPACRSECRLEDFEVYVRKSGTVWSWSERVCKWCYGILECMLDEGSTAQGVLSHAKVSVFRDRHRS